ncbi:MAG: anti-sigma factor [Myxococcales bacterium FL481]|nr:MAG: anti-sigma factor [Myxococcales bacterium FL481]
MKREDVPTLLIEQLAAGLLPADEARAVRQSLGERAAAELEAIGASNARILGELTPAEVAAEVSRRASPARSQRYRRAKNSVWIAVPSLAAAAVVLLWWRERPSPPSDRPRSPTPSLVAGAAAPALEPTRSKGLAPHLTIARKRNGTIEKLVDGATARPGDVLQLGYVAAGRGHGVILSFDGRGVVTLHHPATIEGSTELQNLGEVALGFAYELDDAPQFERFFLLTFDPRVTESSVGTASIVQAAKQLASEPSTRETGSISLPSAVEQSSILLRKPAG